MQDVFASIFYQLGRVEGIDQAAVASLEAKAYGAKWLGLTQDNDSTDPRNDRQRGGRPARQNDVGRSFRRIALDESDLARMQLAIREGSALENFQHQWSKKRLAKRFEFARRIGELNEDMRTFARLDAIAQELRTATGDRKTQLETEQAHLQKKVAGKTPTEVTDERNGLFRTHSESLLDAYLESLEILEERRSDGRLRSNLSTDARAEALSDIHLRAFQYQQDPKAQQEILGELMSRWVKRIQTARKNFSGKKIYRFTPPI
jgi:hypothetical protein